jgi:hypothetical protein
VPEQVQDDFIDVSLRAFACVHLLMLLNSLLCYNDLPGL